MESDKIKKNLRFLGIILRPRGHRLGGTGFEPVTNCL